VLIGGDFIDRDKHLTPLSISDGAKMPGVMVQAQILAQLLDGRSVYTVGWLEELVLLAAVAFVGFFSRQWQIRRYDLLLYIAGLGALILLGIALFSGFGIIAPSTTLFFAWTLGVTGGYYAPRGLKAVHAAG
jgi:CHASE2 domain-containing sensor protein